MHDDDERDLDDIRDAIEQHFANKPPQDRVPRKGLDRDTLLKLDAMVAGQRTRFRQDGELLDDGDGNPLTVTDPQYTDATVAGVIVTRRQLDAAGVLPGEVPHIRVIG